MVKLHIQAITNEYGCVVYTEITLPEDYTMNMVVNEVKRRRFSAFKIVETTNRFVEV